MRHETALAEQLKQVAPEMAAGSDLYNIAVDLLRKTNGDAGQATAAFVSKVFAFNLIYPLARAYLSERAAEMKGDVPGHLASDTHAVSAGVSPHQRDGRGQRVLDTHVIQAAPSHPIADGRSQIRIDTHSSGAPSVREPSPLQKQAAGSMRLKMAETVLDTFKVRDGRAIGRVYFRELPTLTSENVIEAAVLRQVQTYAANVSPGAQVCDVLKAKDLEAMIAKAKADARVAA